jgi:protein phosphatase
VSGRSTGGPERPLLIRGVARTDVGRRRTQNEDAFGLYPDLALFVVADGIGGRAGGRIASTMAVEAISQSVRSTLDDDLTPTVDAEGTATVAGRRLGIALTDANQRVLDASRENPALQGMGAAVAAVLLDPDARRLAVAHVGDTRVYRVRGEGIEQLTEDHTIVQRLLKAGKLAPEEVATSAHQHVLTQAVGVDTVVHPDVRLEAPQAGDVFVLTSDGVHDVVRAGEILEAVRDTPGDLEDACRRLIDLANARGGKDNSTVVAVACATDDDEPTLGV